MESPPQDQQQFEEVLSQLDAMLNRGHLRQDGPRADHATPPAIQPDTRSPPDASGANQSWRGGEAVMSGEVPVLTEIYAPVEEAVAVSEAAPGPDEDIEQAILDRWLPALHQVLDEIVEDETRRFREELQQRLQLQVSDALKQHLRTLKTQTEM